MLSQNLEGGSNYASDMLILVYLRVHGDEKWPRPGNSSGTNQDHWTS